MQQMLASELLSAMDETSSICFHVVRLELRDLSWDCRAAAGTEGGNQKSHQTWQKLVAIQDKVGVGVDNCRNASQQEHSGTTGGG
jgi:hypothetical protein